MMITIMDGLISQRFMLRTRKMGMYLLITIFQDFEKIEVLQINRKETKKIQSYF